MVREEEPLSAFVYQFLYISCPAIFLSVVRGPI